MSDAVPQHQPVLADRVTELLAAQGSGVLIDATVGAGGHAAALLDASGPGIELIGLDRDPEALSLAERALAPHGRRARLVHAGYDQLGEVVVDAGPVLGVLYDLGVSSMQLDRPERGFSITKDAPLDMRMDPGSGGETAADLVNGLEPGDLERALREGGEDRHPRRIARALVAARPLATTGELAEAVVRATPARERHGRTHPATRTFQALRIAVNREIERFRASLPQALELLQPASDDPGDDVGGASGAARPGRVAVLAYHSLEDRLAKQTLAQAARGCVCPPDLPICGCGRVPAVRLLTRGAEQAGGREASRNPRSRSVRLRAAERTSAPYPHP